VTQALNPRLKSVGVNLVANTATDVYVCPSNFTAKVDLIFVANNTNGNKTITIEWYDYTNGVTYSIAPGYIVSSYNFLQLSDGYLIMNSGDKLIFTSESGSTMSAIVSVSEYFDPANANVT